MNAKKFLLGGMLISALTISVVSVSAQPRGGGGGDRPARDLIEVVAEATGLEPRELAQEVRGGATLSELITANGGDVQVIADTIIGSLTERINTAVTNGRITQEQADELTASLNERVTAALNGEYEGLRPFAGGGRGDRGGEFGGFVRGASPLVSAISEATGLDQRAIVEAVIWRLDARRRGDE
ncbi:MAG: hypothetical protein HC828_20675 [Blastochloris sp.]|nr:hypothetical protein [Blastochloris sp.]